MVPHPGGKAEGVNRAFDYCLRHSTESSPGWAVDLTCRSKDNRARSRGVGLLAPRARGCATPLFSTSSPKPDRSL
jgi:hypothetical protein